MNIIKKELKSGLKSFIFWTLGLLVLVFAGITKYTGISMSDSGDIQKIIDKFPKVIMAVFGMNEVDIKTLSGYYSVIAFYAMICAVIYAIWLGANAVSRESIDKTYEFLFTKPRSRSYILALKLISGFIYLTLFCTLNYVFSLGAVAVLGLDDNINYSLFIFCLAVFIVGVLFFALASFLSAAAKKAEKGALYGNLSFLIVFILGIIYDMLDNGKIIRIFTPMKYFLSKELLNNELGLGFLTLSVILSMIFLFGTFIFFNKKDLSST